MEHDDTSQLPKRKIGRSREDKEEPKEEEIPKPSYQVKRMFRSIKYPYHENQLEIMDLLVVDQ